MSSRQTEVEDLIKAYADASEDAGLQIAIGTPGRKVMYQDESTDTGQQWLTPGFMEALTQAIGIVSGYWQREEFSLTALDTTIQLSQIPVGSGSLMVFKNGGAQASGEFSWTSGTKIISFDAGTAGTLIVHYQAKTI